MKELTDKLMDDMITIFKEADAVPVACTVIDKVLRSYFHWLDDAQREKSHPADVRNAMLHLISCMIMEASQRMGEVTPEGDRVPKDQWLGSFVVDLRDELIEELNRIEGKNTSH